jgi:hypothetical protein
MRIIGGEGYRSYGLIRCVGFFKDDISEMEYRNNKIMTIKTFDNNIFSVGDNILFKHKDMSANRNIKEFEEDNGIVFVYFVRRTFAYSLLLPLSDFEDIYSAFNAYIHDDKLVVHVTGNLSGRTKAKTNKRPFYSDKYNCLYYADIKEEYLKDYAYIINSKYSHIGNDAIKEIEQFNDWTNKNALMAVKKSPELIKDLSDKLNISESFFKKSDVELINKMNMESEVMNDNDLINDKDEDNAKEQPIEEEQGFTLEYMLKNNIKLGGVDDI